VGTLNDPMPSSWDKIEQGGHVDKPTVRPPPLQRKAVVHPWSKRLRGARGFRQGVRQVSGFIITSIIIINQV
jgi:hypothetical protein